MEIPEHFKFVRLHEFQIMPNHIHGMIEINHNLLNGEKFPDRKYVDRKRVETARLAVSTPGEPNDIRYVQELPGHANSEYSIFLFG